MQLIRRASHVVRGVREAGGFGREGARRRRRSMCEGYVVIDAMPSGACFEAIGLKRARA